MSSSFPVQFQKELDHNCRSQDIGLVSADHKVEAVIMGLGAGFLTFISVEVAAGFVSVIVRLIEQYTKLFYLGEEWNNWLGVVFLYWAIFPAAFIGLVVCARTIKSRWNR